MWMRCNGGRRWGCPLTPRINWSNSNNNNMVSNNNNISNSNLWIFIRQLINNSLRWILGLDSPLPFNSSLLSCLPQATSSRCSLVPDLNNLLAASEMPQIKWDRLILCSNNHRWGKIWFNNRIICWDNSRMCSSNPHNKFKEVFCLSSSKCWTLWIILNGHKLRLRLSQPLQCLRLHSTITKPWI